MEWVLKIVEGPMTGAEVALVSGTRITFGSADTCDVVIADAALAPVAFLLDIAEDGVTLLRSEDDADGESLAPFVIRTFGATAFAIGPAEGVWEELKKPAPKATAEAAAEGAVDAVPDDGRAQSPSAPDETADRSAAATDAAGAPHSHDGTGKRHRGLLACCATLVVLAMLIVAVWYFWPAIAERCPLAEKTRVTVAEKTRGICAWARGKVTKPAPVIVPGPTLEEIAKQYHLTVEGHETRDGQREVLLKGNLKWRTERLAIRALALAADPRVKFDLTDDETLASAADALLFTVTEGAVKVSKAENRAISLSGKVGSREQLEMVLRALAADVPGLDKADASQVTVVPGFQFAAAKSQVDQTPQATQARPRANPRTSTYALPVAGILTKPYACVVLHDGRRCVEGGYVGAARLVKIAADALTLEIEGKQITWRP